MNDLLVLLWLGDVSSSVSGLFSFLAIFGFISSAVVVAFRATELGKPPGRLAYVVFGALFCFALIAAALPSRQWFYVAAGGTAAVKALDSELGQKVTRLVEQKIDEALGEGK